MHDLDQVMFMGGLKAELPVISLLEYIPLPSLRNFLRPLERVRSEGMAMIIRNLKNIDEATEKSVNNGQSQELNSGRFIFSKMLEPGSHFRTEETADEIGNLMTAATETVAVQLAYTIWLILSHSDVRARVTAEIASLPPNAVVKDISKLTYLDAVIKESARLHGSAVSALLRQVPEGGRMFPSKHWIPAEIVVSAQAYTTQRNSQVFPNPEV